MVTLNELRKKLEKLIGSKFDKNKILETFKNYQEFGDNSVVIYQADYDKSKYFAHINQVGAHKFIIEVDENNIITGIFD